VANNGDEEAIKTATKPLVQAADRQIEAILTPEQAVAYKK